jgi:predicted nuclease of predicted toxin-antitoxin system
MRILLDENMSYGLARDLDDHECQSVGKLGWQGTKSGALLARAEEAGFAVLITLDDDIRREQNMAGRSIAILVLKPRKQGMGATRELAENPAGASHPNKGRDSNGQP